MMMDFSHGLMGWNALFSLVLFGAALGLGWLTIHMSFETTAQALAARATADLASVQAELEGLGQRVSRLEQQVAAITERLDRCEGGGRGSGKDEHEHEPTPTTGSEAT
jgi:hypothetical protein